MRAIVPIHQIKRKVPEQGRIRMGVKVLTGGLDKSGKPKSRPSKLSRLRFTSQDRGALDVIAAKYGGEVLPWSDAPTEAQFQVTVTQEKIPVVLPPDPLSGTPIYEHWSGGGCLRRCDGIDCTLAVAHDAGPDAQPAIVECPCRVNNRMLCKPRTRLNVVLREVPFGGTWRIESTGWNAAEELPGMVDMVLAVQETGMVMGELSIGQRTRLVNGQTKKFVVPSLTLPESIEALAAGQMRLNALGRVRELQSDLAALPAPAIDVDAVDGEQDWVDAEVVDEEPDVASGRAPGASGRSDPAASAGSGGESDGRTGADTQPDATPGNTAAPVPRKKRGQTPRTRALHAVLRKVADNVLGVTLDVDQLRHGLVLLVTEGATESSNETTDVEQQRMLNLVDEVLRGERRVIGLAEDGHLRLSARKEAS